MQDIQSLSSGCLWVVFVLAVGCGQEDVSDTRAPSPPETGAECDSEEVCDGIDNDCDGLIDDADDSLSPASSTLWYPDADQDGYGGPDAVAACEAPAGHVSTTGDCDETDPGIHPGAREQCTDVDHDCDGRGDDNGWAYFVSSAGEETDIRDLFSTGDPEQEPIGFNEPGTVYLCQGVYYGQLIFNNYVSVVGHGSDTTFIIGEGLANTSNTLLVYQDLQGSQEVPVNISGLTFSQYGGRAIWMHNMTVSINDVVTEMGPPEWGPSGRSLATFNSTVDITDLTIKSTDVSKSELYFAEGSDIRIDGLSLTRTSEGRGIWLDESTLDMSNALISGCMYQGDGAGLSAQDATLTITSSEFRNNHAFGKSLNFGGAIYGDNSTLQISDTDFFGNSGEYGGAIGLYDSDMEISSSTFRDNFTLNKQRSNSHGGAIYTRGAEVLVISDSVFEMNTAQDHGGGIYIHNIEAVLSGNRFSNNQALAGDDITFRSTYDVMTIRVLDSTFAKDHSSSVYLHKSDEAYSFHDDKPASFTCNSMSCLWKDK